MPGCCGHSGHRHNGGGHSKTQVMENYDSGSESLDQVGYPDKVHSQASHGTRGFNWAWVIGAAFLLVVVAFYLRQ